MKTYTVTLIGKYFDQKYENITYEKLQGVVRGALMFHEDKPDWTLDISISVDKK